MAFSVPKSLSLRSLGLYKKHTGKHAAPKGWVPESRSSVDDGAHRPAHAATMPRLTSRDGDPAGNADAASKAA